MSRSFAGGQLEKGHSELSRQRDTGAEGSDDKGFDMSCTSVGYILAEESLEDFRIRCVCLQ